MFQKISYLKKSFFILFFIGLFFIGINLFFKITLSNIGLMMLVYVPYLWAPGILSLYFAKKEHLHLPVFKNSRHLYLALSAAIAISLAAFLITMPFGTADTFSLSLKNLVLKEQIKAFAGVFFQYYILISIIYLFLFLGGELYWRGYLWEKLKSKPSAVWIIAFAWTLWTIPFLFFPIFKFSKPLTGLLQAAILNFSLTPVLLYHRIKSQSILTSALFCSLLLASHMFFNVLFLNFAQQNKTFSIGIVIFLIIESLLLNLYSPKTWQKLAKKESSTPL